jgi:hypothetical protein
VKDHDFNNRVAASWGLIARQAVPACRHSLMYADHLPSRWVKLTCIQPFDW